MSLEAFLVPVALAIIGIILKLMVEKNREFFVLLTEFSKKLPPSTKKAEVSREKYYSHMDLGKQRPSITEEDLDRFQKELEDFNYNSIIFKRKRIKQYSSNIQRVIKTTENHKMMIGVLQEIFESEKGEKMKPYLFGKNFYQLFGF